jgi:HEAT repeat protein
MSSSRDEVAWAARERLTADDPRTRVHALYVLGEQEDRAALPQVVALLGDEDHRVRVAALHLLGKLRYREALPRILPLLQDKELSVRAAAVAALSALGDPHVVEPLLSTLGDPREDVRKAAVDALAEVDGQRARDALLSSLREDPSWSVRHAVVEVLSRFVGSEPVDPEIVAGLIGTLRDPDEGIRAHAAVMLGTLGAVAALPTLEYLAANDTGEYWGPDGYTAIASTAEQVIAAIQARRSGGEPEGAEQILARHHRWRHRMPDYASCRKAYTRSGIHADDESPFPDEHDPPGLVERIELRFTAPHRGPIGKITVEWYATAQQRYGILEDPALDLRIPWNAWGALAHCTDLVTRLGQASGPAMQPDAFVELLRQSGFEDLDATWGDMKDRLTSK